VKSNIKRVGDNSNCAPSLTTVVVVLLADTLVKNRKRNIFQKNNNEREDFLPVLAVDVLWKGALMVISTSASSLAECLVFARNRHPKPWTPRTTSTTDRTFQLPVAIEFSGREYYYLSRINVQFFYNNIIFFAPHINLLHHEYCSSSDAKWVIWGVRSIQRDEC
jgi:hypothetical protein